MQYLGSFFLECKRKGVKKEKKNTPEIFSLLRYVQYQEIHINQVYIYIIYLKAIRI